MFNAYLRNAIQCPCILFLTISLSSRFSYFPNLPRFLICEKIQTIVVAVAKITIPVKMLTTVTFNKMFTRRLGTVQGLSFLI